MSRRSTATNPEEAAQRTIASEISRMIETLSSRAGPAADAQAVSPNKQLAQWAQRDPLVQDPDMLTRTLTTTGLGDHPELFDPRNPQALGIVRANPDLAQQWAQLLATPLDERMAAMIVPLLDHPMRLAMLRPFEDDPEAMVKFSDGLDARLQRQYGKTMGGLDAPTGETAPMQQAPSIGAAAPMPAPPMPPPMGG